MKDSFRLKTWVCAILIALVSGSAVDASSSAGRVNCVVEELRRDFLKSPAPGISIEKLTSEIASRRARVPEFEFIRKEAERRGLRVWLFGGTAAGYGHYVKWDLLREAGDLRFQEARFDYDYTNIYRSTQDLDIVVDGSAQQAQEFQQALKAQFPYFVGSKATPWEVRSLRESSGDKGAILDDFGFMNQHTDSNSTGMIELTNPPKGESVVRDVRDWKNRKSSQFLRDVHEGKLTYYFSPTHDQTGRAKEGKNPPIFSVVRALTKAFQYDLKIRPEDFAIMRREIDAFQPSRDLATADAQRWLEKNGKKLYQHAVDIEYASDTLDKLGLKKKLIAIKNDTGTQDSLAWWMNKEPLKSKPVGEGNGKTAQEQGLDIVAHETGNFLAYESITRAHTGEPNVLISRKNTVGEAAAYGDGFYTKIGGKGARGTGMTIRFSVEPKAREGADYFKPSDDFIVWTNKNAIRVIPESLEMSPFQYFEFLAEGKNISQDDKALLWKLKRKLQHSFASGLVDSKDLQKIRMLVLDAIKTGSPNHELLFKEWVELEGALAGIAGHDTDKLAQAIKPYRVDPGASFDELAGIIHGSALQKWINQRLIPGLLKDLKLDIGDRAIENALASPHRDVRKFGLRALEFAEKERPSARLKMLRKLTQESPNEPMDRGAVQAWLKEDLQKNSSLPLFQKFAHDDPAALSMIEEARTESFQFQRIEVPPQGLKVTLGVADVENPQMVLESGSREVTLTEPFEIQLTPVTQLQWALVMKQNLSSHRKRGKHLNGIDLNPDRPVELVSWSEAQQFIEKLNKLDSKYRYRLPTGDEWEASARAGTRTAYSFGDDAAELSQYEWHDKNSGSETHDVASLKPNPFGLYDMHGNVGEWVQDKVEVPSRPWESGRVIYGGAWSDEAAGLRSGLRTKFGEDSRGGNIGFRLVRVPRSRNPS